MDGVSFVGLHRPVLLSPKSQVLGLALEDAVVGPALYTKGVCPSSAALTRLRQRAGLYVRHLHVPCLPSSGVIPWGGAVESAGDVPLERPSRR